MEAHWENKESPEAASSTLKHPSFGDIKLDEIFRSVSEGSSGTIEQEDVIFGFVGKRNGHIGLGFVIDTFEFERRRRTPLRKTAPNFPEKIVSGEVSWKCRVQVFGFKSGQIRANISARKIQMQSRFSWGTVSISPQGPKS
jgi:hypothetical protein